MKLYIISGLGADFKVLERIRFPKNLEVVFLDWLIPIENESFDDYVDRMASKIDRSQPFSLLGYSFGGLIVQEIYKKIPAEKIIILGSIKSDREKSKLLKMGQITRLPRVLPTGFFNDNNYLMYSFIRKIFDPKNPAVLQYFRVKHPYYIKWSITKIAEWKFKELPEVIQIMGDKDIVFPIQLSNPDYIVKGGTHLFPATKHREVSGILDEIFS